MSSILIHGGTKLEREKTALKLLKEGGVGETGPVQIGEDKEKIGIKEIKALLPHLHVRSTSKKKAVIIFEAQRLTTAAQNCLLKILEEPPAHLLILLTVPNPRLLLSTVVSRCITTPALRSLGEGGEARDVKRPGKPRLTRRKEIGAAKSNSPAKLDLVVGEILSSRSGQRLALFEEKIGYKQASALAFLDKVETQLENSLKSKNTQPAFAKATDFDGELSRTASKLLRLWQAKKLLREESANVKLIIDELLLSTPLSGGESKE